MYIDRRGNCNPSQVRRVPPLSHRSEFGVKELVSAEARGWRRSSLQRCTKALTINSYTQESRIIPLYKTLNRVHLYEISITKRLLHDSISLPHASIRFSDSPFCCLPSPSSSPLSFVSFPPLPFL